jgi:acetyl-CoA acetyltransferase
MGTRHIVLSHPVRTAIGAYSGTLKSVPTTELGAIVVREALRRAGLGGDEIGTVVMGNVIQAGNRMNPVRQASIGGGLPVSVPAMTVNRVCGSGAQAILTAALEIAAGDSDAAIAGGMENMDRVPYLMDGGRWGYRMGPAQILDSMLTDGLNDAFSSEHSGWHTEDLVTKFQISRAEQDAFAARSQQRFAAARNTGRFADEIVPVEVQGRKGTESFAIGCGSRLIRRDPGITTTAAAVSRTCRREGAKDDAGGIVMCGRLRSLNHGRLVVFDRSATTVASSELLPPLPILVEDLNAVFGGDREYDISNIQAARLSLSPDPPSKGRRSRRRRGHLPDGYWKDMPKGRRSVPYAAAPSFWPKPDCCAIAGRLRIGATPKNSLGGFLRSISIPTG